MKLISFYRSALFISAIILLGFSSCIKDEEQEEENINVLKIKIGTTTFVWSDTDGAGGTAPKIDTIKLTPNSSLSSEVLVQDGSVSPAKDFTTEVITESDEHLFIYKTSSNISVTDLSKDKSGKAFGQTATVKTTTAGAGTLNIVLKHLPNKDASDPSATGETDIDVTFPVVIK